MDFAWSAEQDELRTAARAVAERLPQPVERESDAVGGFSRAAWDAVAGFGLTGLSVPAGDGGLGLDHLTTAYVLEGFGEGCRDLGLLFSAGAHLFACCGPIARSARAPLRSRLLPQLATGRWIGANAMTESEAGSDLLAIKTRAVRDGACYRISGEKAFVTNGPVADVIVVYASTDPAGGYLSLSAFAVARDTRGLEIGAPLAKCGLDGSPIGSVYLDDCVVSSENMIGREGQGSLIFQASMHVERACIVAGYLGAMARCLGEVVTFARERRQFGRPIGRNQALSHRIAKMKLRLEAARLLVYRACWELDRGRDAALASSLAKVAVSDAAIRLGLDVIHINGGMGVMSETGIDRLLRDSLPSTIFSGTSEMQLDIVAGKLGL